MVSCRYVGSDSSEVGDREFDEVGQRAVFSEVGFKEACLGGAAFITEEEFKRRGFTAKELEKHGPCGARIDPPHEFLQKLYDAQQVYRDTCARMRRDVQEVLADVSENSQPELVVG